MEVLKQDLDEKIYWILIEEGQRNLEKTSWQYNHKHAG